MTFSGFFQTQYDEYDFAYTHTHTWTIPNGDSGTFSEPYTMQTETIHPLFNPIRFWDYVNGNIWVTADRRQIPVEELEDSHLLNLRPWFLEHTDRLREIFREAKVVGYVPLGTTVFGLQDFPLFAAIDEEAQKRGLGTII